MYKIFSYSPIANLKQSDYKKNDTIKNNHSNEKYSSNRSKYFNFVNFTGNRFASNIYPKHNKNTYEGCILGGALGDAYGAPVEFTKWNKIKKIYGDEGLRTLITDENGQSKFTDDTQLTIFTADGLLKSGTRDFGTNKEPDYKTIFNSYKNWHSMCAQKTQNGEGWISELEELLSDEGSGPTCTNTLAENTMGNTENPINNRRGGGGVMRAAPVGLMYYKNPKNAFKIAVKCAALTHGSPSAYLPAGVYASIISNIVRGKKLEDAINSSIEILKEYKRHERTLNSIKLAQNLASQKDVEPREAIKQIGQGFAGNEAIAIAIYCSLKNPDNWEEAVIDSINHNGDSDTVGSITGGIMGAYLGSKNIPQEYKEKLLLNKELKELSYDLLLDPKHIRKAGQKYPVNSSVYDFQAPEKGAICKIKY